MLPGLVRALLGIALLVSAHGAEEPVHDEQLRLDLAGALRLRFAQGRDRQDALDDLTLARSVFANVRNAYRPQWRGSLSADANGRFDDDDDEQLRQELALGMAQTLPGGGRVDVDAAIGREQELTGGGDADYDNTLDIALRQPLLRDAGMLPWRERLTQTERDLVYARRSHERFLQELA
ncbi:MAG: hypothetical protein ACOCXA_04885, partial [Planctomycetota bacterium]